MNGILFRSIMRGPYIGGKGYKGWDEEHAKKFVADFVSGIPKVESPTLKKNSKSYTLTWAEGKTSFKALFCIEEDTFGGPCYRDGEVVFLSFEVSSQTLEAKKESKADAKKDKADAKNDKAEKKEPVEEVVEASKAWVGVENSEAYLESHIRPLFYYLCIQAAPSGVVFL